MKNTVGIENMKDVEKREVMDVNIDMEDLNDTEVMKDTEETEVRNLSFTLSFYLSTSLKLKVVSDLSFSTLLKT